MLAFIASHEAVIIGVIFMLVIGPAVGNYACSVIYRLPLGRTPFERAPFCGHCHADLQPIDLFPIVSWLMTRGRCRYCEGAIPALYTWVEVACGALFIANFLRFGMGEFFLLCSALGVLVVILAAIEWQQGWISASIYSYIMAVILLIRTLNEGAIYGAINTGITMLVMAMGMARLSGQRGPLFDKPWVWWLVLMGALLPWHAWPLLIPIGLVALLVPNAGRVIVYAASTLALPLFI